MALWNNFPYSNVHELNLNWVIETMKYLIDQWESYGTTVNADAVSGLAPNVTVTGDLKQGLTFHFTLVKGDQGDEGPQGVGITSATMDASYQLTLNFSDGTSWTSPSLRGATGAGLMILDEYATLADLQTAHPTGDAGDAYLVGVSPSFTLYIWSTANAAWVDGGALTTPSPTTTTPLMDGSAAVGSENAYARGDHVHPSDTSKQDVLTAGSGIDITGTTISLDGTIPSPSNSNPLMDGSADAGTSSNYSRSDHVHPKDSSKQDVLTAGSGITITGTTISADVLMGIDTSNVLATFQNESSYTATEDGYVIWWAVSYDGNMSHGYYYQWVDGVQLQSGQSFGADARIQIPLKAGQTFEVTNYNSNHTNKCNTIIYGVL